jgi:hypothetical protein
MVLADLRPQAKIIQRRFATGDKHHVGWPHVKVEHTQAMCLFEGARQIDRRGDRFGHGPRHPKSRL